MSEDQLQATCYKWLHNEFEVLRGCFFSVPNGSTRHPLEAVKLKATGLVPGIPDCILVYPCTIGFEFKTEVGVLSLAQKQIHEIWISRGIPVYVIRSVEEFKAIVLQLLL